jgi:hypothetical protein
MLQIEVSTNPAMGVEERVERDTSSVESGIAGDTSPGDYSNEGIGFVEKRAAMGTPDI